MNEKTASVEIQNKNNPIKLNTNDPYNPKYERKIKLKIVTNANKTPDHTKKYT